MSADGKSRKIGESARELSHYAEKQRLGHGRIEVDDRGGAMWIPSAGKEGEDGVRRVLDEPTLAIAPDYRPGTQPRIQENQLGVKKGYDPYDSGLLVKMERNSKKDLRRLGEWLKTRKSKGA